jgi:hexokinase
VVSDELKTFTGTALFDFFARCVENFLIEDLEVSPDEMKTQRKLGFTFSFPVNQSALDKGTSIRSFQGYLMYWTKGFTASGVVGVNVISLLQAAFQRRDLNIKVTALVNDTVGTLVSHAYVDPQTYVGIILGTGANAAYVEKIDQIRKWKGEYGTGEMLVNMEWGAFDEDHLVIPESKYDKILDRASKNVGRQTYEKMIGGMYLGEVVRITVVDLMASGLIFPNVENVGNVLGSAYKFETAYMSRIERDHSQDLSDVNGMFLY